MTLQSSGAISLSNIAAEMGGSTPHSLSEYYKGGGLVGNHSNNPNIPTSGAISFSNFYGANNTAPGNSTATMNAGSHTDSQKFQTTYNGYSADNVYISDNSNTGFGSASDNTIKGSNGTEYTIIKCYSRTNSVISNFDFTVSGNHGTSTFYSVFGYNNIKWGSTTVANGGSSISGSYNSSENHTRWLLGYNAVPSGNATISFS